MKLRDILILMYKIHKNDGISMPYITGGVPRDKILGIIRDEVSDLDITTGDASIHNLAKEFSMALGKQYNIDSRKMDDGHTSVYVGDLKVDFSSNFRIPHIEEILKKKGIKSPSDIQQEMFSRDFTCNALLMTLDLKKIKDPTKRGFADIKNKILKTCLSPDTTLRYNPNRIIRTIYLASKLEFDVDPEIIKWIANNKEFVRKSSESYLSKHLDKALDKDPDRAVYLINKMGLWDVLPITRSLYPYYAKKSVKEGQLRQNYDYGEGLYINLDKYKSVSDFRKKRRKQRMRQLKKIKNMKLK